MRNDSGKCLLCVDEGGERSRYDHSLVLNIGAAAVFISGAFLASDWAWRWSGESGLLFIILSGFVILGLLVGGVLNAIIGLRILKGTYLYRFLDEHGIENTHGHVYTPAKGHTPEQLRLMGSAESFYIRERIGAFPNLKVFKTDDLQGRISKKWKARRVSYGKINLTCVGNPEFTAHNLTTHEALRLLEEGRNFPLTFLQLCVDARRLKEMEADGYSHDFMLDQLCRCIDTALRQRKGPRESAAVKQIRGQLEMLIAQQPRKFLEDLNLRLDELELHEDTAAHLKQVIATACGWAQSINVSGVATGLGESHEPSPPPSAA